MFLPGHPEARDLGIRRAVVTLPIISAAEAKANPLSLLVYSDYSQTFRGFSRDSSAFVAGQSTLVNDAGLQRWKLLRGPSSLEENKNKIKAIWLAGHPS